MVDNVDILAFDLGAESGRAILGHIDGERLHLTELHRFANRPVVAEDGLHWDVEGLFAEIKRGIAICCEQYGAPASIGIDTWGIDFALLDDEGRLLFEPFHYRDRRTEGMMAEAFKRVSRREIFEQTGIQFLSFNTLYQLLSMALARSPLLARARTFLTISDLLNFRLTGRTVCEFTNATTTQFFDPRARAWATTLLERLGIPTHFLPDVIMPGTVLGPLLPSVGHDTGCDEVPVVAPACHDTGSAVAAVPADRDDFAYVSSGTWSCVGVEVEEPVISDAALAANITNEGGVAGRFRLLRNVAGLWLLQECRRIWAAGGAASSYDELVSLALQAPPFVSLVDPDDPSFLSPQDMPSAIAAFCRHTGQPEPAGTAATARCVLESLALKYRWVVERIEEVQGKKASVIHIVGGGSRNRTLCAFTSNATGRRVLAGPAEATAAGNVIVQAMALGRVASLEEGRTLVRRSLETAAYEPDDPADWNDAYARFLLLLPST